MSIFCPELRVRLLLVLHLGEDVRKDGAGNVVPDAEDRAGNRGERERRERGRGKARSEAGVLHTDFYSDSLLLGKRQAEHASDAVAERIAEEVVQDDDDEDYQTGRHDALRVRGDDGGDYHDYRGDGDERQYLDRLLRRLAEELVDYEARAYREDDDLHYRNEHRHHVDVDRLFKKQVGERRGDDRGEDGRDARHTDGERDVALAEVGHDVRRGAAGAGADEDDADEQRVVELEELAEREGEERHDGELRDEADDYIARALKDDGEVRRLHRKPHTEHDYHKKRRDPARLYPDKRRRLEQRDGGDDDDDDRHVLSDELT